MGVIAIAVAVLVTITVTVAVMTVAVVAAVVVVMMNAMINRNVLRLPCAWSRQIWNLTGRLTTSIIVATWRYVNFSTLTTAVVPTQSDRPMPKTSCRCSIKAQRIANYRSKNSKN